MGQQRGRPGQHGTGVGTLQQQGPLPLWSAGGFPPVRHQVRERALLAALLAQQAEVAEAGG